MSKRIEKQAKFGNREQLAQIAQKVAEADNVDFGMKMLSGVSNETATTVNNAREEIVRPPPKSAAPQIQHHKKLSSDAMYTLTPTCSNILKNEACNIISDLNKRKIQYVDVDKTTQFELFGEGADSTPRTSRCTWN
ncbi:unnamed protein product [Didymodactylos carnosus]|uniref:Uncharacterized protein n=2 Tax=Didymodactylos carnosus TaxID=1234261 RepID=A0A8S2J729_9BILA|nr:unnamed protein product [Didymodactylos carnosus]CAF3784181.1 unnamed protein product [Didymodactylos carnosus]